MMTAGEIKNKFIHTLRWISEAEVDLEWKAYVHNTGCTDEFQFIVFLRKKLLERIDG